MTISPERRDALQQDWARLLDRYGVESAAAYPPFDLLAAAYSAPDRHYHTLEHLAEMFKVVGRLVTITDDPGPLHLAVWFHDAIYDTRAKDNESRSADLAIDLLAPLGVPAAAVDRVVRLVRATAHLDGDQPPPDRETMALLDADLAILGAAEDRYRRYATDIRKEYAWVRDADYWPARAAVLERFLARPRIYWHDVMFQEGEGRARANLRAELAELRAGGPG